jgi:hypothetical protein
LRFGRVGEFEEQRLDENKRDIKRQSQWQISADHFSFSSIVGLQRKCRDPRPN